MRKPHPCRCRPPCPRRRSGSTASAWSRTACGTTASCPCCVAQGGRGSSAAAQQARGRRARAPELAVQLRDGLRAARGECMSGGRVRCRRESRRPRARARLRLHAAAQHVVHGRGARGDLDHALALRSATERAQRQRKRCRRRSHARRGVRHACATAARSARLLHDVHAGHERAGASGADLGAE